MRYPGDRSQPLYQVLRALGSAYGLARALNPDLSHAPRARGRLTYKLLGTQNLIGADDERWIEMSLLRDDVVAYVTTVVMTLQRAGGVAPVEAETRTLVEAFWASHPGSTIATNGTE